MHPIAVKLAGPNAVHKTVPHLIGALRQRDARFGVQPGRVEEAKLDLGSFAEKRAKLTPPFSSVGPSRLLKKSNSDSF